MLRYKAENEDSESPHFFIYSHEDQNVYFLQLEKKAEEDMDFHSEFFQKYMTSPYLVKWGKGKEVACHKELAITIKSILENHLTNKGGIAFIMTKRGSAKHLLIKRLVNDNEQQNIKYYRYVAHDYCLCFIFDRTQIEEIKVLLSIHKFFNGEFGLDFLIQTGDNTYQVNPDVSDN